MRKFPEFKVTFKKEEMDIYNFANEHSSPTAYIKDLIRLDMKKQKSPPESAGPPQIMF